MPYKIKQTAAGYAVYKKSGGKRLGTHSSAKKAQAQIKAIHANKKKKKNG